MENGAQSVEQFLHGLAIASGEELMQRLTGMQTQIDAQQHNFSQQMSQALTQNDGAFSATERSVDKDIAGRS